MCFTLTLYVTSRFKKKREQWAGERELSTCHFLVIREICTGVQTLWLLYLYSTGVQYSTSTNVLVRQEKYGVKSSRYSTGCFYLIYSTVQPFMWFTVLLAPLSSHMYLNALYFYLYEHKVVIRLLVLVLVLVQVLVE